jgi:hypothetical protein
VSYCSNCANIEAQLRDLTVANAKQAEVIREREAEREALLEVFATIESESYTTKGAYKGALCDVLRWLNATLRSKPSPTSKQDSRTETMLIRLTPTVRPRRGVHTRRNTARRTSVLPTWPRCRAASETH